MICGVGMVFSGFKSAQTGLFGAASMRRHMTGGVAKSLFMEVEIGLTESGYLILEPGHGRLIRVGEPLAIQNNLNRDR